MANGTRTKANLRPIDLALGRTPRRKPLSLAKEELPLTRTKAKPHRFREPLAQLACTERHHAEPLAAQQKQCLRFGIES